MSVVAQGLNWSQLIVDAGLTERWSGSVDPVITSVVEDSRQASPGSCFVATHGTQLDGHTFIDSAIRAGASAIICERALSLDDSIAMLRVGNARGTAGRLAGVLLGLDQRLRSGQLKVVGITGTNGKSTFCYLLQAILKIANQPTAMLGTVQYDLISRTIEASMTTPPATVLMQYLVEAVEAGAQYAVMEVSSHALDQGRCDGVRFAVGVFSNLTGDHLDYHRDMDSYLRAKKQLFDNLDAEAVAVINVDDPAAQQMVADCRARVVHYGITDNTSATDGPDVSAVVHEMTASGTKLDLVVQPRTANFVGQVEETHELMLPLVGRHNVQNGLAAASAAIALGVPLEKVIAGLMSVQQVPGRLQRVIVGGRNDGNLSVESYDPGFAILVDYAHTDDALVNVLSALRTLPTTNRLIVLLGCGGDRDRSKRPRMAAAAAMWADDIVVTSDNPRTEDPQRIIADILRGFTDEHRQRVHVEPDRRKAIAAAIALARAGDVVLLAGKGHENYQIVGNERYPFDDAAVAADVLRGMC